MLMKYLTFKRVVILRSKRSSCCFFCHYNQTQTSSQQNFESHNLWCLFAKIFSNINTTSHCNEQCYRYCFHYLCVKLIFFWFYRSNGSEENNKYAKRGNTSATECTDIEAFTLTTWQIRSCFLCKFILSGATVLLVFRIFFIFFDKRSESSRCFIEASSEIRRKIKI